MGKESGANAYPIPPQKGTCVARLPNPASSLVRLLHKSQQLQVPYRLPEHTPPLFAAIHNRCVGGANIEKFDSLEEEFRDEILTQLRAAMPVDGVVLGLHGAMVAHGYDDVEGDLLSKVRHVTHRALLR